MAQKLTLSPYGKRVVPNGTRAIVSGLEPRFTARAHHILHESTHNEHIRITYIICYISNLFYQFVIEYHVW